VDLLLCSLSLLELLSQLGTAGAQEAFDAIQAFSKIHNPQATPLFAVVGRLPPNVFVSVAPERRHDHPRQ
jgi:hypothetical protein